MGLARAENLIDATQNLDMFVEVSGMLRAWPVTCSRSATICDSSPPARTPDSANSCCRPVRRARASCQAKSTR